MATTTDNVIVTLEAKLDRYTANVARAEKEFGAAANKIQRHAIDTESAAFKIGSGMKSGFNIAKVAFGAFAAALTVQGIVNVTTAIVGMVEAGLKHASTLNTQSQQLGISTDALQEYNFAAAQSGVTSEQMASAFQNLNKRLGETGSGSDKAAKKLTELGISMRNANGSVRNGADLIPEIADAISKMTDESQKATAASELFGDSGAKLLPLLNEGAAGVNNLRNAARELGIVLSEDEIRNADKTANKLEALKSVLAARIAGVVVQNADAIDTLAQSLFNLAGQAIAATGEFIRFQTAVGQRTDMRIEARKRLDADPRVNSRNRAATEKLAYANIDKKLGFTSKETPVLGGLLGSTKELTLKPKAKPKPGTGTPKPDLAPVSDNYTPKPGGVGRAVKALSGRGSRSVERAADEIESMLLRMNADLMAANAELTGNLRERADAEKARIAADLFEAQRRLDAEEGISAADKLKLKAVNEETAVIRSRIVEQELQKDIAEEARDLEEKRLRDMEDSERDRQDLRALELDALAAEAAFADTVKERRDLERQLLLLQQEEERLRLEAAIALGQVVDATKARAALERRQAAERRGLEQDQEGPGAQYLRGLNDEAKDLARAYEEVAVRGFGALEDGISNATKKTLGLHGALGDIINDIIQIGVRQALIRPLAEALFGGGGGGGIFGSLLKIGSALGGSSSTTVANGLGTILPSMSFGRASGGHVRAGQAYPVGENGVEIFQPSQSGKIIPNGQLQPGAGNGGKSVVEVHVVSGEMFDARVSKVAGDVSVQTLRSAAPVIVEAAAAETSRRMTRPRM